MLEVGIHVLEKTQKKGLDRRFCLLPKPKLPINLKETVPLKGDMYRTEG